MIVRSIDVPGGKDELLSLFLGLLDEIGFTVIHREETGEGFRVIGASSKRRSQLTATMMNLFIGYIHRNRVAVELDATQSGDTVHVLLRSSPYLDVMDMEAFSDDPEERERCARLADFIQDGIADRLRSSG